MTQKMEEMTDQSFNSYLQNYKNMKPFLRKLYLFKSTRTLGRTLDRTLGRTLGWTLGRTLGQNLLWTVGRNLGWTPSILSVLSISKIPCLLSVLSNECPFSLFCLWIPTVLLLLSMHNGNNQWGGAGGSEILRTRKYVNT